MTNQVETCRDRDCARVSKFGEGDLDYGHVISMSLEKISSERRRRSGANLHRSLMICDLLVRLRAHALANEGSEVRPTVQPEEARQSQKNELVEAQPSSGDECDTLSQPTTAPSAPAPAPTQQHTESCCDESANAHAPVPAAATPADSGRSKCERRKRRRFSVAADPNDADKRCRLVPENTNDPEDPSAYVSVSVSMNMVSVSSLGSNPVPHNVGSYILPSSSVLLNYPGQHNSQTNNGHDADGDADGDSDGDGVRVGVEHNSKHQANSMPFVFVIE